MSKTHESEPRAWWPINLLSRHVDRKQLRSVVAGLLAGLLSVLWPKTEGLSTDQLLEHALLAEQSSAAATRVERMLFSYTYTPPGHDIPTGIIRDSSSALAPKRESSTAAAQIPVALLQALQANHFEWAQPPSVSRFAVWRNAHTCTKHDRIIDVPDPTRQLLMLATTIADGDLREVDLTFDARNYRLLHQTLVFPAFGRVDADAVAQNTSRYTPSRSTHTPPPAPGVPTPGARPNRDDLDRAELTALLKLAQAGLETRRDIRVLRTPELVRVEASVSSATQRTGAVDPLTKVAPSLAQIKHVTLDIHEGPLSASNTTQPARTAQSLARAMSSGPGLHQWLERRLDDQHRASFVPKLARAMDRVERRLLQLSTLGRAYPESHSQSLSTTGRDLFRQLIALHYHKLCGELDDLRQHAYSLGGTPTLVMSASASPADLIARAPVAQAQATRFEQLVLDLFAHQDLAEGDEQRVQTAFVSLWEALYGPRIKPAGAMSKR
jgi:hypothetical protein